MDLVLPMEGVHSRSIRGRLLLGLFWWGPINVEDVSFMASLDWYKRSMYKLDFVD
ncbi:hypothetical protein L484_016199 [Morus notabilis]|uniref:Uncharacterized protein n=1 Tax=Morus notabilis TaxID=981085 RepID=W9RX07_9ROSA|nr:hypothetical protein L484_016199 [Morus notabilis]